MTNSKLVYGVGVNDRKYTTGHGGKPTKEYVLWFTIIQYCYNPKFQAKHHKFIGCLVSDNFLNYSKFHEWCHDQTGFGKIDANGRHWHLDKDILVPDNKIYSENICVFVPKDIMAFFNDRSNARGEWPIGVYFHKPTGKFLAHCNVKGNRQHLGSFNTPEDAHAAYKAFKEALCKELANKWRGQIDERVYDAMMVWSV